MSEGAESERAVVTSFLRTGLHDNNTGLVLFSPTNCDNILRNMYKKK